MTNDSTRRCVECGAEVPPGETCREQFEFLLGHESDDADLAGVHHLTVLCYTLQHPQAFDSTPEGHAGAWELLCESVSGNLPAGELRRRNRARLRRPDRPRLRARGRPQEPLPPAPTWSYTVVAVVHGPDEDYAGRVRVWARALMVDGAQTAP